jgi:hypothetical protein
MVYESALDLPRLGDVQDEEVDRIRAGETVLDSVNRLVDSGYLESTVGDFCSSKPEGRQRGRLGQARDWIFSKPATSIP